MMPGVMGITTHVLDTSAGRPATGVAVVLEMRRGDVWESVGQGTTDDEGRLRDLLPDGLASGPAVYRMRFDTASYFAARGVQGFYPQVAIEFEVTDAGEHHHVPLLLSPFGYSTYRGS
jgi:5-hydroxyisourate hydrolase